MRFQKAFLMLTLATHSGMTALANPAFWVEDRQPKAAIVLADDAFPIAIYAAEELAHHIKLATGAELPIIREAAADQTVSARIYVGQSQAAKSHGIDYKALEPEHCVLRRIDNDFFIVGNDGSGDPLDTANYHSGTLWGVYEILERLLDARWLWPGEGGVDIRRTDTLAIPDFNETISPHFKTRLLRTYIPWKDGKPVFYEWHDKVLKSGLSYSSTEARDKYIHDQQVFLRRHRMGQSQHSSFSVGHTFSRWWKEYGETHPEWFQLIPEAVGELRGVSQQDRSSRVYGKPQDSWKGRRGPDNPDQPYLVSMCVSNPELHQEIIRRWEKQRAAAPGENIPVSVGENDIWALCVCDACRALDAPQPSKRETENLPQSAPGQYRPFDAGRRYAWFYQRIHELASKIDPDAIVLGYVYLNYFIAPKDIKLSPNVILNFVPWGGWYYPRDPRAQGWLRDQWDKWRKTGATLFFRPNFTLDGGSMPLNYHHQMGEEFQYFARHGCIGTHFDYLTGQWSAQGATLYLLARQHTRPDLTVEQLLEEYYGTFGPAALHVKAYFDFWEAHATANAVLKPDAIKNNNGANLGTYARGAYELYPPEVFDQAEKLLLAAKQAIAEKPDDGFRYAKRLEFLHAGLVHARKSAALSAVFADPKATEKQKKAAIDDLVRFRRSVESLHIANFQICGQEELRSFGDKYDFSQKVTTTYNPADHEKAE